MNRVIVCCIYLSAACLFSGCVSSSTKHITPATGQTHQKFVKWIGKTLRADYLLYLPENYYERQKTEWPLILFLHGAGERGTKVWKISQHGPPRILMSREGFPFIVVAPLCPRDETWDNETLIHLLDEITAKFRVDTTRIYLTGLSMGGYGAWSLGLAHPERFAAMAPLCGGGMTVPEVLIPPEKLEAIKTMPIWAFHGAKDTVVPLEESKRMVEFVRKLGNANAQLFVFPEAGHDVWTETYQSDNLYDWFLQHKRMGADR